MSLAEDVCELYVSWRLINESQGRCTSQVQVLLNLSKTDLGSGSGLHWKISGK